MKKSLFLFLIAATLAHPAISMAKCTSGNCQDGAGVFAFNDGDVYAGDFKKGQLHGKGKLSFKSGGYYEGDFLAGKFEGSGVMVSANGKKVTGEFSDNKLVPPVGEMSDDQIMEMLTKSAKAPNHTKYLTSARIAIIRKGWAEEQITDKKRAIESAFDYLLRVNDHYRTDRGSVVPTAAEFKCDGRQYCTQMTSKAEAEYFVRNCPDTEMDGDHDGIPCENDSRF